MKKLFSLFLIVTTFNVMSFTPIKDKEKNKELIKQSIEIAIRLTSKEELRESIATGKGIALSTLLSRATKEEARILRRASKLKMDENCGAQQCAYVFDPQHSGGMFCYTCYYWLESELFSCERCVPDR